MGSFDKSRKSAKPKVGIAEFSGIPIANKKLKRGAVESSFKNEGGGTKSVGSVGVGVGGGTWWMDMSP